MVKQLFWEPCWPHPVSPTWYLATSNAQRYLLCRLFYYSSSRVLKIQCTWVLSAGRDAVEYILVLSFLRLATAHHRVVKGLINRWDMQMLFSAGFYWRVCHDYRQSSNKVNINDPKAWAGKLKRDQVNCLNAAGKVILTAVSATRLTSINIVRNSLIWGKLL